MFYGTVLAGFRMIYRMVLAGFRESFRFVSEVLSNRLSRFWDVLWDGFGFRMFYRMVLAGFRLFYGMVLGDL